MSRVNGYGRTLTHAMPPDSFSSTFPTVALSICADPQITSSQRMIPTAAMCLRSSVNRRMVSFRGLKLDDRGLHNAC